MVFTVSLNLPVRRALGKQVLPSTVSTVTKNLVLDPATTKMNVVILGPKDFAGPKGAELEKALNHKHPNICVIYLYTNNEDSDLCPNAFVEQAKKITDKVVSATFEKYYGAHMEDTGQMAISSADFDTQGNLSAGSTKKVSPDELEPGDDEDIWAGQQPTPPLQRTGMRPESAVLMPHNTEPDTIPQPETVNAGNGYGQYVPNNFGQSMPQQENSGLPTFQESLPQPEPKPSMPLPSAPQPETLPNMPLNTEAVSSQPTAGNADASIGQIAGRLEQRLAGINSIQEWGLFKEALRHDSIISELVMANSEYEGLVQMLEVLDTRIQAVWRDSTKTPEQKFTEIKQIGLQKSTLRAGVNAVNVEKAISIISTIVVAAQRTVDAKLNSIDASMYKISSDANMLQDTAYIDKAIQQRTKVQMELLETARSILDIYMATQNLVSEEIKELDRNLPSSNDFINEMTKPIGTQIFTPPNTADLVKRISTALQENKLIWSQLEERVDACIDQMYKLCKVDEDIINYQNNVINMLKANKVENVVIADTLLKRVLRVYTGADNTGRSSTTITWSGILSRRGNVLLIDLTGRAKFKEYGLTPILLSDFTINRIERPFLCVETRGKLDAEELTQLVQQIRTRLNYYQYVNVIVAPEDIETLKMLCEESLVVHYITNCSTVSIEQMNKVVAANDVQNVARKLIIIDTPISPLSIADSIGIDPTNTKLITLPAMNEIRACALKHDRPYDYEDITRVYEEAFR